MIENMFKYIKLVVFLSCLLGLIESRQSGQKNTVDTIAFPEVEENIKLVNKNNRRPVYLPSMCPENELYYPGDQENDWICDCRPGHIFHTKTDKCWAAYRKGPCEQGYYLTMVPNSVIPECVLNPCGADNMVKFNGDCVTLGDTTPCGNLQYPIKVVWVNATTLVIDCLDPNGEFTISERISETPKYDCPVGCRRFIKNKC